MIDRQTIAFGRKRAGIRAVRIAFGDLNGPERATLKIRCTVKTPNAVSMSGILGLGDQDVIGILCENVIENLDVKVPIFIAHHVQPVPLPGESQPVKTHQLGDWHLNRGWCRRRGSR